MFLNDRTRRLSSAPSIDACASRLHVSFENELMQLRRGYDLDEAARLAVEGGAERVTGYLTLSGREPPP